MIIDEADLVIINNPITFDERCMLNGLYLTRFAQKVYCFYATCATPPKVIMRSEMRCPE